jgi:hypothetical protein
MTYPVRAGRLLVALLVVLTMACDDRGGLRDPPLDPDPIPIPIPDPLRVDYRVLGTNVRAVEITYFSSTQGTAQTRTDLPWFLTYQTRDPSVFVYLSAAAPLDPLEGTLIVQIFLDGVLFREARSSGFAPSVTVSGEVVQ